MSQLAKLRLIKFSGLIVHSFLLIGFLGLFTGGPFTLRDGTEVVWYSESLRQDFLDIFYLHPLAYIVIGMVGLLVRVGLYCYVYINTDRRVIDETNANLNRFVKKNWWKIFLAFSILFTIFIFLL